ncbi:hypothetical protein P154DRAFT_3462 [Amniculicola lignicola CBS 123094]|uniref:PD-(D/E)XK nuclease-like domain-containing protein n=1 Tax=Amniculicola lignicola CBS 123094 TaxID=1392246 RepID=A0A6A5X491_9PLEO|nr:hypothetical protein P154DRAFT_3462 [Amniculicola lignicola CBS 123094]
MYGKGKWWLQNVQSQSINPDYLSIPITGVKEKFIDRKTDYTLSYSHRDADISSLYSRLAVAYHDEVSHVMDTFTKRTALFSGLEIKPSYGIHTEAELQMSIWIAASLRKKMELARTAGVNIVLAAMAEPALTIVGHEHCIYYAYPRSDLAGSGDGSRSEGGVHVLASGLVLRTDSVRGVFQLLQLYRNLLEYGMDKGDDGYWGRFLGRVLEGLASGRRG